MKHILHTKALVGLTMMLAGAVVVACKKDPTVEYNPPVVTIAGTPFTLSAEETRGDTQYVFPWTVSKTGVTDSVKEELDEMTVTSFNTITFTAKPDGGGDFPGVNVRSSNVGAVQVSMKGKTQFSLKYIGDGESTITVWNGNESDKATSVSFKVQARKTIPVEGLLVRIDGEEEVLMKAVQGRDWNGLGTSMEKTFFYTVPYLSDDKVTYNPFNPTTLEEMYSGYDREDLNLHKAELLHLVPENTTFRRLNQSYIAGGCSYVVSKMFCAGEYDWFDDEIRYAALNQYKFKNGTDICILYGKSFFFGSRPRINPGLVMDYYAPSGRFYLCEHTVSGSLSESNISEIYGLANAVRVAPKD